MTLRNLETNSSDNFHFLGELTTHITDDGSLSLRNAAYKESFHSLDGALKEAREKYLRPAEIMSFKNKKKIAILDVCFGLGYNSACILEELLKTPSEIIWRGLEIDPRPLKIALINPLFKANWSDKILGILASIEESHKFHRQTINGTMLWGDARKKLNDLPNNLKFDLILHDAFSPSKCPHLWSEEFLNNLSQRLSPNGKIITYSSAAAIRGSLKRAGLQVHSIVPSNRTKKNWSAGTVAILRTNDYQEASNLPNGCSQPLSDIEEEHLLTVAAIPYRDPSGNSNPQEILNRRKIEQLKSNLSSTSSWRKRLKQAQ